MLLAFYRRYLPPDRTLVFSPRASAGSGAAWRIREDVVPAAVTPEADDERGRRYRLAARYPFYGLSGSQWSLYERVDSADAPGSRGERRPPDRD